MTTTQFSWKVLPFLLVCTYANAINNSPIPRLNDVVVTVSQSTSPTEVRLKTKTPVQPLPANDGAGLLKTVPNMSVIRKGGTSGDPLFRGLGGSRLAITADDSYIFGGCGGRMDPPTAYIFPDTYDEVIITKGPQTVTRGPGIVTGAVAFKRKKYYFEEPDVNVDMAVTAGSFKRFDAFGAFTAGMPWGYIHANANRNISHDYKDGDGNQIHSAFQRQSQNISLGLTPDRDTLLEVGYSRSRGWASYADRMMDGSVFDRDAWNIRAEKQNITSWLSELRLEYGHSRVDHVMDNYSFRTYKMPMAMNPSRTTNTLRLQGQLELGSTSTKIGVDWMNDQHRSRMGMGMTPSQADTYRDKPYRDNQKFRNIGFFAETTWNLSDENRLIGGLRHDRTKASYEQGFGKYKDILKNNPSDIEKTYALTSGFLRYEHDYMDFTYFAGYGVSQRSPDFWERNREQGWSIKPETNHEIDLGLIYRGLDVQGSLTVFASQINDFILIDDSLVRNISARRYGLEGDISYQFAPHWKVGTSMALTYGKNRDDDRPLAQTPPFEANTYIGFDNEQYSVSFLMRNVASQHRFAKGQGNIVGTDVAASSGFTVFSLNAGWKINKNINLTAGVDNIFNKQYREFISKTAADVAGYNPSIGQLYEPGRQFWVRLQGTF